MIITLIKKIFFLKKEENTPSLKYYYFMYILIVYYFYILSNIKLSLGLNKNNKKNHCKNTKISLDTKFILFFLFLRVFEFFYYTIKIEKYFFIPALFSNDK
jgi:hypothetical protein